MRHKRVYIMSEIKSSLNMDKLVFDHIEFTREGFKNDSTVDFTIETRFAQNQSNEIYRVTLILKGEKKDEYVFEISLTGFFSLNNNDEMDDATKNELISKNTVAIMMPYLRAQVSLLTAQPEVDCVVLPPFNINKMIVEENEIKE